MEEAASASMPQAMAASAAVSLPIIDMLRDPDEIRSCILDHARGFEVSFVNNELNHQRHFDVVFATGGKPSVSKYKCGKTTRSKRVLVLPMEFGVSTSFTAVFSVPNSCSEFVHTSVVMSTDADLAAGDAPSATFLFLDFASATPRASPTRYSTLGRSHDARIVIVTGEKPSVHNFCIDATAAVPAGALARFTGLIRLDSASARTARPRPDPPDAAVRRTLCVCDDVLLIASEVLAEQVTKEHFAKDVENCMYTPTVRSTQVLVLISQLDRAASTELVTWRRDVDSSRPATEQPLVAWAMSMLWDSKGYRMLADLTVFDAAAGTGRAQQPQRHVVSAFINLSVTRDVSVSFDAHLVRGRVPAEKMQWPVWELSKLEGMHCISFGARMDIVIVIQLDFARRSSFSAITCTLAAHRESSSLRERHDIKLLRLQDVIRFSAQAPVASFAAGWMGEGLRRRRCPRHGVRMRPRRASGQPQHRVRPSRARLRRHCHINEASGLPDHGTHRLQPHRDDYTRNFSHGIERSILVGEVHLHEHVFSSFVNRVHAVLAELHAEIIDAA